MIILRLSADFRWWRREELVVVDRRPTWDTARRCWRYAVADVRIRVPSPRQPSRSKSSVGPLAVCLTSFPARIGTTWKAVESLLRQEHPADAVVLTLSTDEFPRRDLPKRLQAQCRRGLEIRWVAGNMRSHKKLIPPLRDLPGVTLVTADDDIVYPLDWLVGLVEQHRRAPRALIAHRCLEIIARAAQVQPYHEWPPATTRTQSDLIFPTTGGGVLCPPGVLPALTTDDELALRLTPTADDIWLRAMAWLGEADVKVVRDKFPNIVTPPAPMQVEPLCRINATNNDRQFAAVLSYFGLWDRLRRTDAGIA